MSPLKPTPYLVSTGASQAVPLERFLPLHSPGIISAWLKENSTKGEWSLDPLGASPQAVLEAARAGSKVLVACNNPVTAFELRMLADPPERNSFRSVIAELAEQKKGAERLEVHIRGLYLTRCASCGSEVDASAFLWRRGETVPYARLYACPKCNDAGEHPVTDEDIQRLQSLQRSEQMHRARALEQVLGTDKNDRENVEEALKVYPLRPLYVLFTLLNKLDGMRLEPRRRELLECLLLSALETGAAIWDWPEKPERPRQLNVPPQYIEKNLWLEMENAVSLWGIETDQVELTSWPEVSSGSGICLYPGRMRDLAKTEPKFGIQNILCAFPRPNQAYWTLCALWSAWLWGRERSAAFSSVLDRRRFDWYWHTRALHSALTPASGYAKKNSRVFGILAEPATGLVDAVIESAAISGMELTGCAVKNEIENIQMEWRTGTADREFKLVNMQKVARGAIRELLQEVGEPTEYIEVHTAAMAALAEEKVFPPSIQQLTYEKAGEIQSTLTKLFADRTFLRRMESTAQDPESGTWWLAQQENCQTPLADRLENEVASWFQEGLSITDSEVRARINQRFPGYLTPPDDLVQYCLESYAELDGISGTWSCRSAEKKAARDKDIVEISGLLNSLEEKFNVVSEGENPILWYLGNKSGTLLYRIFMSVQANISREACIATSDDVENIFILPGSRAALLRLKLDRDPYLRELVTSRWHFLKFRTLRSIASRRDVTLDSWKQLIDSDPISVEETTQLSMF